MICRSKQHHKFATIAASVAVVLSALFAAEQAQAGPPPADVPDFRVRVKVLGMGGKAPAADQDFSVALTGITKGAGTRFKSGDWSPWEASTREGITSILGQYPNFYNCLGHVRFIGGAPPIAPYTPGAGAPAVPVISAENRLRVQVETAIEKGETRSTEAELMAASAGILLWRDIGALPTDPVHIDTLAGHGRRVYRAALQDAYLPPADRPKQIIFGDRYIGDDDDALAWREGIDLLAGMGINALQMPALPALRTISRNAAVSRFWGAVYNPPGYAFNFKPQPARREELLKFVREQVDPVVAAGWKKSDIAFWITSDEPGWYYPSLYDGVNNDPNALASFHDYLKARGFAPKDFGKVAWNDVRLIGRRQYTDLASRRLFYWANRFVPWASSHYFGEVTRAYEEVLRPQIPVMTNFNNFAGTLYTPGPVANNNLKENPNAAMGQHDWMEFGRERGGTAITTEDWFTDSGAPIWSYYASRMRSAAELSNVDIGAFIVPRMAGDRPNGITQKIMAMVGHGSKTNHFFIFGPEYSFPSNCYSENPRVYKGLSNAMKMTARAEDLLFPGRQRAPQVAMLMPQSSQLWDLEDQESARGLLDATNNSMLDSRMAYVTELSGLYVMLQHLGIPVRFVDEQRLAEAPSKVAGRGLSQFKVIYATAPDIPQESMAGLLNWVRAGGTLVTTAGTATHDRYHQASSALSVARGSTPAAPIRAYVRIVGSTPANGSMKHAGGELPVFGEREKLSVQGARVTATFEDGSPAVTEKTLGRGRIIHFASYPGISYYRTTTGPVNGMWVGHSQAWRDIIAAPVRAARAEVPVESNVPYIEVPALYSDRGIAVTLLNWSGVDQKTRLNILVTKRVARVESVERGAIPFRREKGRIVVDMNIGDVDVLKVYYAP